MKALRHEHPDVFKEIVKRFKLNGIPTILTSVIESKGIGELEWELLEYGLFEQTSALWDGEHLWITAYSSVYDQEYRTELPYYHSLYATLHREN